MQAALLFLVFLEVYEVDRIEVGLEVRLDGQRIRALAEDLKQHRVRYEVKSRKETPLLLEIRGEALLALLKAFDERSD